MPISLDKVICSKNYSPTKIPRENNCFQWYLQMPNLLIIINSHIWLEQSSIHKVYHELTLLMLVALGHHFNAIMVEHDDFEHVGSEQFDLLNGSEVGPALNECDSAIHQPNGDSSGATGVG